MRNYMPTSQAECDALTPAQVLRAAAQDAWERAEQTVGPAQERLVDTARALEHDADVIDPPHIPGAVVWWEVLPDGSDEIRLTRGVRCF